MSLYGFHNVDSLKMFDMLTSVSGIGPKGAMGIMGTLSLEELRNAIAFADIKAISSAPGIGKKTAERLVLELKDKVGHIEESESKISLRDLENSDEGSARKEAINALIALGYSKQEAFSAVSHVGEDGLSSEEYIRKALKSLF